VIQRKARRVRRTNRIQELTARSLDEFVRAAGYFRKTWKKSGYTYDPLWFRGQDASKKLIPKLYRQMRGRRLHTDDEEEDELRYEFQQRAVQFPTSRVPAGEWEWYFLMQHYGMPTRLLDWSEGSLLALHFAIRSNTRSDAAVWVLDPWWLNKLSLTANQLLDGLSTVQRRWILEYMPDPADQRTEWIRRYLPETFFKASLPKFPAALKPPYIDRRIAAQLSAFTIHGAIRDGLGSLVDLDATPRLGKIRIQARHVERVREDLVECGVVETTVFQDLEGLARELSQGL